METRVEMISPDIVDMTFTFVLSLAETLVIIILSN